MSLNRPRRAASASAAGGQPGEACLKVAEAVFARPHARGEAVELRREVPARQPSRAGCGSELREWGAAERWAGAGLRGGVWGALSNGGRP
jgi:hypothetical protein